MFGNSEWFADSTNQRILRPAEKNGWIYYGAWLAAIALPTMILLTVGIPQAIFWMAISSVGFVWDYRRTLSNKRETQATTSSFSSATNRKWSTRKRPVKPPNTKLKSKADLNRVALNTGLENKPYTG